MFSRRQFLTASAISSSALLVPSFSLNAADVAEAAAPPIHRKIPSTGESIPVIGAGTSGSFEVSVDSPEYEQLKEVMKLFFDGGARLIDTSPNYGGADTVLGQLLDEGGWRKRCFLATKIAADSRSEAEAQWAESLQRLRTDKVELLQVHNLRDWKTQLPYARELKEQGKTRYIGITHYIDAGLPELEKIMRSEPLDFIQIHYSVNAPKAAETVLPLAQERGIAVLINRTFDDGRLFSKVKGEPLPGWAKEVGVASWGQLFLKFAISHPATTAVIPATGKVRHQIDNLGAGRGPLLSKEQQNELIRRFA